LRYVEVNAAACRIIGREREEIVGQEVGAFSEHPIATRKLVQKLLDPKTSVVTGEVELGDGKPRHLEYTAKANVLPGMHLAVVRDVTERKRLEQQLEQAQKMEAVGLLAGGIAHDFNNLLTAIRGYGELLKMRLPQESEYRRYVDNILNASERATMTTQQLLAFSRGQVTQLREININKIVREIGKLLQKLIGEDIELRISLDDRVGTIMADPGQMGQILLNLAVNSRDAMPNGGTITVETQNVKLDESYARTHLKVAPGDYVMMSFTDTGCGMTREVLSRIFEPFFTTKAAGKGTGLGLSTVYGMVEQAHGAVYVYSEPGEGTSFKIYFPRADKAAEEAEAAEADGEGACVLVIDDDLDSRQLLAESLRNHGYGVITARSGGEALQICNNEKRKIDLVISDVTMPGADGIDLQGYFGIEHPQMKVIFVSGYPGTVLRERGILAQEAAFLQKPFRWEDLRAVMGK
jgi:two-component system, cell cycle sensor histidine kinase and response regulator CckA